MRKSHRIVYIYVIREFILSFFIAFLFFFIIFFINQILVMAEQIFAKKVPFSDVILLIVYSMPIFIAFSFPFGSLVGALMAVGRMSTDNEILAFQASGISLTRILVPLLIMGFLFTILSFITNDYFLPAGNIKLGKLYRKILYSNPSLELEPYSIKNYQNTTIITGKVVGKRIYDITIIDRGNDNSKRTITAKEAELSEETGQRGVVSLNLHDVTVMETKLSETGDYSYSSAENMIYNILIKNISYAIGSVGPAEMSSVDVWKEIVKKSKALEKKRKAKRERIMKNRYLLRLKITEYLSGYEKREDSVIAVYEKLKKDKAFRLIDKNLQYFKLEFYKKFAIPVACFFFIFLAFPLGLFARRSGRAVGFGIGLIISTLYWAMLFAGQTIAERIGTPPFISIWSANLVVLIFALIIYVYRVKR